MQRRGKAKPRFRAKSLIFVFDSYVLDTGRRELRCGDTVVSVQPQVFDLLEYLIRNRGHVVSRDELLDAIWSRRIVSESTLATRINAARSAIGDDGESQRLIRTLPRKGIRFVGEVRERAIKTEQSLIAFNRPAIAVLPFQNMSGDPEQEYFADGMVDEIITGLSRIKWLLVTSRNSSFVYKSRSFTVKEVAEKHHVRYVLEGGVRKSGNRVRITARLIDATTESHLWAEQYDRLVDDVFALQDEIAMCVIGAIEPSLRRVEMERVKRQRPENLDAYDFVLRSLPFVYAQMPKDSAIAIPLLEEALKLEPSYGAAHALLSFCLHAKWARGGLHQKDRISAIQHARAAIALGNDDATALATAAFVIALDDHDTTTALKLFDGALDLSSSNIFALNFSATTLAWMGKTDLAAERAQQALRLSPFDTITRCWAYHALAIAHFHASRYSDAATAARSAIDSNPAFSVPRAVLVAALVGLGRVDEARVATQSLLEHEPSFTIAGLSQVTELEPAVFRRLAAAWREVGLLE